MDLSTAAPIASAEVCCRTWLAADDAGVIIGVRETVSRAFDSNERRAHIFVVAKSCEWPATIDARGSTSRVRASHAGSVGASIGVWLRQCQRLSGSDEENASIWRTTSLGLLRKR